MRTFLWIVCFSLLTLAWSPNVHAKKVKNPISWDFKGTGFKLWLKGQYRPRLELRQNRDLKPGGKDGNPSDQLMISHRARLGAGVSYKNRVHVYVELQDVRVWGTETNTLGDFSADGFDLHQGWIQIGLMEHMTLKIGRMEFALNNHRLIGSVGWAQQARAFNGISFDYSPTSFRLRAFYASLPKQGWLDKDAHLALLWFQWKTIQAFRPSVMYILDTNGVVGKVRHTLGLHAKGKIGSFGYTGEFFYQLGSLTKDVSIQAFLAAVSAHYTIQVATKPSFKVWAEFISGDQEHSPKVSEVFDTLFATNHKFYGYADLFLSIPKHTQGGGLMDIGGRFRIQPAKRFVLWLDAHYFRLLVPRGGQQDLGIELDLVAKYSLFDNFVQLYFALGTFIPQKGITVLGKGQDIELWGTLQANVQF